MTSVRPDGTVEFKFYRPEVSSVSIAGDFNDWCQGKLTMQQQGGGWWVAAARLPAGEYRFRYCADGQWFTDFASHGVELQDKVWTSVLLVHETRGVSNPARSAA